MSSMAKAVAESAAAAQRLRREAEKGIRFRRSAGKLVQARRVAKGMNIGKYGNFIGVFCLKLVINFLDNFNFSFRHGPASYGPAAISSAVNCFRRF